MSVSFAARTYDVSYFWGTTQHAAKTYANKVKQALGPNIAKQIKVVKNHKGQYGVIYDRDGNYKTAPSGGNEPREVASSNRSNKSERV